MEPIERPLAKGTMDIDPFRRGPQLQMTHHVSKGQVNFFDFYVATSVFIHKLLCSF